MSALSRRRLFGLAVVAPVAATLPMSSARLPAYGSFIVADPVSPEQARILRAAWDAARDIEPILAAQRAANLHSDTIGQFSVRLRATEEDPLADLPDGPDNGGLS